MNEIYNLCQSKGCTWRAQPGRPYCIPCEHAREGYGQTISVRVAKPNVGQTAAVMAALKNSEVILTLARVNVEFVRKGLPIFMCVGWMCRPCGTLVKDLEGSCKCPPHPGIKLMKMMHWKPVFSQVTHD